jgi:ubiquinone/menaquinone biosynthesis C-methylase UbiE
VIGTIRLAARMCRLAVQRRRATSEEDYDDASATYDEQFSSQTGRNGVQLLEQMELPEGARVVDLGCGTGQLTLQAMRKLDGSGSILAVDSSPGMLARAKDAVSAAQPGPDGTHIEFRQADMASLLANLPPESVDAIIFGWSICYGRPVRLLRSARRAVRPGGQVGVIETRKNALKEVDLAFRDVLAAQPNLVQRYAALALPRSKGTLRRWYRRSGWHIQEIWDGAESLPARKPREIVQWMLTSGAAAGFINALDQPRRDEITIAVERRLAARYGQDEIPLQHTFVAGLAKRA